MCKNLLGWYAPRLCAADARRRWCQGVRRRRRCAAGAKIDAAHCRRCCCCWPVSAWEGMRRVCANWRCKSQMVTLIANHLSHWAFNRSVNQQQLNTIQNTILHNRNN